MCPLACVQAVRRNVLLSAHNYLRVLLYLREVLWAGAATSMSDHEIYRNPIFHT